jgi:glycosyltransferase involved in cell wall biosynthesis
VKICLVTQWFDPEGGSAAIPGSIARSLQRRGHDVHVVTGFPNYPQGKLYDGYRMRLWAREVVGGVRVTRLPLYPSHDRSAARRALNFVTFMLSASTFGAFFARKEQVALVYSTPGTVGLAGVVLRRVFRRPFVLYVQDLWPDTVTASGMVPPRLSGLVQRLLDPFCILVYRAAGRIAVNSPGMKDRLVERGVASDRVDVVFNWVDEQVFAPLEPDLRDGVFDLMYAGNLGDVQGLDTAVQAMALLSDAPQVHLRLVGDGVARPRLEALARKLGVDSRVHFEGARPVTQMAQVLSSAHAQLICLSDDPLFHITTPSKLQAILACGRPVVTSGPGDVARLTQASGAGLVVPPGDPAALARAVLELAAMPTGELEAMGDRGRAYYESHLSEAVGASRLEISMTRALAEHERRTA